MATSTTVRETPNASAASGAFLQEFAVRFRQKRPDVNLYVTALPLKTLLGRFQADTYRSDNRRGYQRAVTASRLRQISSYMREEEGAALLERQGERDYQRARATLLTDILNSSSESPWRDMIRMPGESLKPEHMMKQHSIVSSLEPVVNDTIMKRLSDDEAGKLLLNYWSAARDRWASAFEEPKEYVLQKALGAGALHQIFPDVIELCRAADDFSRAKIYDVLSEAGRSAGFWHITRGHFMVRHNGARYVRALAQ